jgi:hypothetical protein
MTVPELSSPARKTEEGPVGIKVPTFVRAWSPTQRPVFREKCPHPPAPPKVNGRANVPRYRSRPTKRLGSKRDIWACLAETIAQMKESNPSPKRNHAQVTVPGRSSQKGLCREEAPNEVPGRTVVLSLLAFIEFQRRRDDT